eukprot:m.12530 g.12530  ORF g.12530 m.12530 type:complete len:198 (-) comp7791_c0_seq1:466-1059(-)
MYDSSLCVHVTRGSRLQMGDAGEATCTAGIFAIDGVMVSAEQFFEAVGSVSRLLHKWDDGAGNRGFTGSSPTGGECECVVCYDGTGLEVGGHLRSTPPDRDPASCVCMTCGIDWRESHTDGCLECGGAAMTRMCGMCEGKCPAVWQRDVIASHTWSEAHWDGECLLPSEQQELVWHARMLAQFQPTDDDLVDALAGL